MDNIYLKKYILDYLKINNYDSETFNINLAIKSQYYNAIANTLNIHVYENQFHQSNLKYEDYLKCDYCKCYLCPKHIYLSNCYFSTCNICKEKKWSICGWCKPTFSEQIGCKYLHKPEQQ
jgi:hypothetical protein